MSSFIVKKLDNEHYAFFMALWHSVKREARTLTFTNERERFNRGRNRCPNGAFGLVMPIHKASVAMT